MIGAAMNTSEVRLITRAISRPAYRSRITEMGIARVEAAPTPCSTRAISRVSNEREKAARMLKPT